MPRPVAIVTGASSGIGATFAQRLAPTHDLLLIARREDRLETLGQELRARHGATVSILTADLTDADRLRVVAERIAAEPALDLVINNAGIGIRGLFWKSDLEEQQRLHRLHVLATLTLSHAALRNLVPRDTGGIINVASVAGFVRRRGSVSYGASKAWITAFTEGLYVELKSSGSKVRVQALCPGFTLSEFHDTMHVDRARLAGTSMWLKAGFVVDQSIRGLADDRFLVVPGWRYKVIVSCFSKLPTPLRLALENTIARRTRIAL